MGHDHDHSTGNIRMAFVLNLSFTIIEVIGGLYTNSLAILADALHDLGDSLSLGMAWYFQKLSQKGRTNTYSYGYKRFSLMAAIINAVVLVVGSLVILSKAVPQLFDPGSTDAQGMMYLAILGVLVNGAAVFRLKGGKTMNEKVVYLHLMEDVLGWVAVLIGSIVMMYFDAPFIDPLLSVIISIYVLFNVFKNLRKSMKIVLQAVPEGIDLEKLKNKLLSVGPIAGIHDCHIWSMDGNYNVMSVHVEVEADHRLSELYAIKNSACEVLSDDSIHHLTMEFEIKGQPCHQLETGNQHSTKEEDQRTEQ